MGCSSSNSTNEFPQEMNDIVANILEENKENPKFVRWWEHKFPEEGSHVKLEHDGIPFYNKYYPKAEGTELKGVIFFVIGF